MRARSLLVCCLAVCLMALAACSPPRRILYQYSKADVSDAQLRHDLKDLRGVDGVLEVLPDHQGSGKVILELYVEEDDPYDGPERAEALGYRRLKN